MVVAWYVLWRMVMNASGYTLPIRKSIQHFLATGFANAVTPLGQAGGEPVMAYIISQDSEKSYEQAFAAVFTFDIVRGFSFFTYTVFGLVLLLVFYPSNPFIVTLSALILVVALALLGLGYLIWKRKDVAERVITSLGMMIKRLRMHVMGKEPWEDRELRPGPLSERVTNFYETVHAVLKSRRDLLETLLVAHAGWFLGIVSLYAFILSMGWKPPFGMVLLAYPAALTALFLPLPGGLGGVEVAMTALLVFLANVPANVASSAALFQRAFSYGINLIAGGWVVRKMGLDKILEGGIEE
jgi:uncharacterized protein (TIRG00374 family)